MKNGLIFRIPIKLNLTTFYERIDLPSLRHCEILCCATAGDVIPKRVHTCRLEQEQPTHSFQICKSRVRIAVITLSLWVCKPCKQKRTLMIQTKSYRLFISILLVLHAIKMLHYFKWKKIYVPCVYLIPYHVR